TYQRGLKAFLEGEMGLPCTLAVPRRAGGKTDSAAIRAALAANPPLVVFGSVNERMYLAEAGSRAVYIPASFPGTVIRRHTGTPFMGYAGATYVVQEVCNALFDALFGILPLAGQMDAIEPTAARPRADLAWDDAARTALDALVAAEPVLVRISAAKSLRDAAEREARRDGASAVTLAALERAAGRPVPARSLETVP
ncbi:MAG: chlorophyllide reductase subunit Z, partial [Caulobacteraceae bacterium]|nr:chlorophyllide reductase subunit Z [Caulobacter sp.]